MNPRTIALCALLLLFTTQVVANPGITDREIYDLGQSVQFTLPEGAGTRLTVTGPDASYRLLGDLGAQQTFTPTSAGDYTVTINDENGAILVQSAFRVIDRGEHKTSAYAINVDPLEPHAGRNVTIRISPAPVGVIDIVVNAPGGKFKYVGPWQDAAFVPKEPGPHEIVLTQNGIIVGQLPFTVLAEPARLIQTDKASYGPGEQITITAASGIGEQWYLLITSGTQTSKYFGTEQTIAFSPLEGGRQMIQAVDTSGKILYEIVVDAADIGVAIASTGFVIEDRRGKHTPVTSELIATARGTEVQLTHPIPSFEYVRIRGLKQDVLTRLRAEELAPAAVNGVPAVRSFAIDPTTMEFDNATISVIAQGTELYKCKDYVFGTDTCSGEWIKVRDLVPGQEYRFLLTPEDPLYSELNTSFRCSCADSATSQNSGRLSCSVFCAFTINIPANATSFYLQSLNYTANITITPDATTISLGRQAGFFDHDDTNHTNLNDARVGNSSATATATLRWGNTSIASSGNFSFTSLDCDNWPNYCIYYVYINASLNFSAPGASLKSPSMNITLYQVNYTLNYTVPGPFSVAINTPSNGVYRNTLANVTFNYTPISGNGALVNCSLWTNETSWSLKVLNYTPVVNATYNYLNNTFGADGTYLWNVQCYDSTNSTQFAVNNFTLIIDATPPVPALVDPANASTYTSGNVITFTYNVSDTNSINNCSLYIDGSRVKSDTSITRNENQTFNHNLINGVYQWSIGCWDVAENFNITQNFTINVSAAVTILTGLWYETDTNNCSSAPCTISAAQSTDGTVNYIGSSVAGSTTTWYVNATSSFIGSNGGFINAGSTVSFSSFFATGSSNILVQWYLYRLLEDGSTTLICANTANSGTADNTAATGTCSNTSDTRLLATDQYLYRIDIQNSHPSQTRTFNHTIDHASSFFNVTNFTQVGTLTVDLLAPTTNLTILQGDSFTLTCNATCIGGSCINTATYAQTNRTGTWTAIGATGNVTLNGSETNPHTIGLLVNTSNVTSFALNGSGPGTTWVRCFTNASYTNDSSDIIFSVTIANNQAPTITLNAPANNSWRNVTNINFTYTPTTLGQIANCTLYINGAFNQTNQTPIVTGSQNNFTIFSIPQDFYNWSVSCTDGLIGTTGNSSNFTVAIDRERPYNITLNYPDDDALLTNPTINFNWTAMDNLAPNMSCQLVINGTVNKTVTAYNGTPANATVGIFNIGYYIWYVNCTDIAGNRNQSEIRNFTINDEAPRVNLTYPANNSGVNTTLVTFLYNASDNYELANCSLFLNGLYNQSNATPLQNGPNNFTDVPLFEGLWNWSVTCQDNAFNNVTASNYSFRVDTTYPNVSLNSPANNTLINVSGVTFSYTVTDNQLSLTCNLYTDGVLNVTDTPTNGTPELNTINGFRDGSHDWNVTCFDIANNTNSSQTWNFTINATPTITFNGPVNNSYVSLIALFNYTATDNDGFSNCSLYINNTYNQTNVTNVTSGQDRNFTLTALAEGEYWWNITCTDAGVFLNTNWSNTWRFYVDTTAPSVELLNPGNDDIINVSSVEFNWTATDNLAPSLLCNISINNTVNVSNIVTVSGANTNYTITGFRTGNYSWNVTCWDNATNTNTSLHRNFSVRIPPKVNLTAPANDTYNVISSLNFSYIPYDGTGVFVNCSFYVNGLFNQTNQSPVTADVQNNFSLLNLPDGRYDWNVTCYDTYGLPGQGPGYTYYVDTSVPYNISLNQPPNASIVTRNNVTFNFTQYDALSPNASCMVWLDDGGGAFNITPSITAYNGTDYISYYLLSDGLYAWNVTCIDLAGNPNSSVTFNFTIIAPPNVTLLFPPNETWNNTGNVTFVYQPDDDIIIKNCSLYLNGTLNQSSAVILNHQNNTFSIQDSDSAIYNWTVGCYDGDDNFFAPANRTLYVDRLRPTIDLNDPAAGSTLLVSSVTFNFTAYDNLAYNLTCNLTINNTVNISNIVTNNSVPNISSVSGFTDGLFLWNVTCVDQAQNANTSLTQNFTIAEPPSILLHTPWNATRTANVTLNFSYTPNDNSGAIAGCSLLLNDVPSAVNATPVTLLSENNLTGTSFTHGTYTWNVNCSDPSGNNGRNATNYTLYIDQQGPTITLTYPPNETTFNTNNITFNWTPQDFNVSVNITCVLNVSNGTGWLNVSGLWNFSGENFTTRIDGLGDGGHYWNVTCVDDLGNANTSLTYFFNINQPDLVLTSGNISFNNTNPDVGMTINITANVSNIGGIDATSTNVSFWDGDPGAGGIYIGSMVATVVYNSSRLFNVSWVITEGYHTIYVSADPLDTIGELNETNNNATRDISVLKINITAPANNTYTNDTTPQISFNTTDFTSNNITYRIFVDGTANGQSGNASPGANTSVNLSALADGIHLVIVQATDTLGRNKNSTAWTLRIDTTAPTVNFTTANNTWYNAQTVTIYFNVTDLLSTTLNWSAFLDGTFNQTNLTGNGTGANVTIAGVTEGVHTLIIQAIDELGNTANSTALTFYVDITPPVPNITTPNNTWFNTSAPNISFNITDNLDSVLNWTFFIDGNVNSSGFATNGSNASGLLAAVGEGEHTIILQAFDEAGNYANSSPITIYVDLTAPNVTLLSPANNTNFSVTTVELNFTASDNLALVLACTLTLDGTAVQQYNLSNGTNASYTANGLLGGLHYWNVTCYDNATNRGVSETWQFYINLPDFVITSGNITFSNATPIENQTIEVNATIFNLGDINYTGNITVQFWLGDPDAGGTQIGSNITLGGLNISQNVTVNTSYTTIVGLNLIYVVVDPPYPTNGSIEEKNETNNKANAAVNVGLFQIFAGASANELHIADASIIAAYTWNITNTTGSNVFVADSESSLSFTSLIAIGRNTTNGTTVGSNDFVEIDTRMNTSVLNDSVNFTFTTAGAPYDYMNLTAFKRPINDIPAINSTNTTSFRTGILWDSSDTNPGFYNGSQDIAFVTVMNQSQIGGYGTYDYEIAIPSKLREYIAGGNTVTFYTELR